ncbi:hypothetical protein NPIL_399061 [Nephila pilipes]|uniref:Uncharacterized protein n=1 Tax=Nephila pilipes TaxID=299642 RepID=A0A8X6R3A7_NEPPI|nr:hypothetical protein NPIL_399061 [Nephila pilipes]
MAVFGPLPDGKDIRALNFLCFHTTPHVNSKGSITFNMQQLPLLHSKIFYGIEFQTRYLRPECRSLSAGLPLPRKREHGLSWIHVDNNYIKTTSISDVVVILNRN